MKKVFFTALLLLGSVGTASATVITFDEPGATGNNFNSSDGAIFAEWVWRTGLNDGHNHISSTGGNPGAYERGHGQAYQGIRFSAVGGGLITLASFDFRGSWLVGLLNDGNNATQYSTGFENWVTQTVGLTASTIYIYTNGNIGAGHLDNVRFGAVAVPEPATLALLGLGLLGIAARRRRSA